MYMVESSVSQCAPNTILNGRYIINYKAGKGKAGGTVYGVKDPSEPDVRKVIKYPVRPEELEAYEVIYKTLSPSERIGVARAFDNGWHEEKPYIVMETLGKPVHELFGQYQAQPEELWPAVRTLGRMVLRRLAVLHRCGLVHCDVQPNNIIMGYNDSACANSHFQPFLIDFGAAKHFPGGGLVRADWGSVDYNSIRSADGGPEGCPRGPHDDVESLGWVLCHWLYGELPWFEYTRQAHWKHGKLEPEERAQVCGRVKSAKAALLDAGVESFGKPWVHLAGLPPNLLDFLRLARAGGDSDNRDGIPNYSSLAMLLGGMHSHPDVAEQDDTAVVGRELAELQRKKIALSQKPTAPDETDDDEAEPDPSGHWLFNGGKSYYTISLEKGDNILWYTQPLTKGRMLTGQVIPLNPDFFTSSDEGGNCNNDQTSGPAAETSQRWQWRVQLSNNGTLRLRLEGHDRMVSSYRKSNGTSWNSAVRAERVISST